MPIGIRVMDCCGWKEITFARGVTRSTTIREVLYDLIRGGTLDMGNNKLRAGAILFTQAGSRSAYGKRLAKLITNNELGKVELLEKFVNPNTGRVIQTFIWRPDAAKVIALAHQLNLTSVRPVW